MKQWIQTFYKTVTDFPNKVAVIDITTNREYTYTELAREVKHLKNLLLRNNVKRGDVITFFNNNCLEHLTLFLASADIGSLFVPLNFRLSLGEINGILDFVRPSLSIGKGESIHQNVCPYIDLNNVINEDELYGEREGADLQEPLLMLFTSGTTGVPKGVLFHGEMLLSNQKATVENWHLKQSDITVVETPFFHTGAYNVLCLPLLSIGGTVILAEKFDPQQSVDLIKKHQVSVYFGVPTIFQMIFEKTNLKKEDLKSIRFFISGGAAIEETLIQKYQNLGVMFKQGYGLTEVGPNCFLLEEEMALKKIGSIGRPMSHTHVKVVNKKDEEVVVGEIGELLLKGHHLCKGYYKNIESFKQKMDQGYFHTGDLVKFDKDGYFYVVGRKKEMYISGGENVYPAEVERQINFWDKVIESVVVSVPNDKWGEVGHVYYRSNEEIDLSQLRSFLDDKLSRYKHPHFLTKVDNFPLLPNGKINKKILKQWALAEVAP
ncbi:MAG: AMP-binding protein [Halobacteriovoraceae bacterium]|nr:AMP-binding protein [Halobacteriovoraceae bacterium]